MSEAPKHQMTLGMIVGNADFSRIICAHRPSGNACGARVRGSEGGGAHGSGIKVWRGGNPQEARRCADLFKHHREAIDGIVVTLPNFGDERAIADALRMAALSVPVLVQATPDTPGRMSIRDRRDSFCGKMSACNNLAQYGIPYSLTTLHAELPQSDIFRRDLEWFLGYAAL